MKVEVIASYTVDFFLKKDYSQDYIETDLNNINKRLLIKLWNNPDIYFSDIIQHIFENSLDYRGVDFTLLNFDTIILRGSESYSNMLKLKLTIKESMGKKYLKEINITYNYPAQFRAVIETDEYGYSVIEQGLSQIPTIFRDYYTYFKQNILHTFKTDEDTTLNIFNHFLHLYNIANYQPERLKDLFRIYPIDTFDYDYGFHSFKRVKLNKIFENGETPPENGETSPENGEKEKTKETIKKAGITAFITILLTRLLK